MTVVGKFLGDISVGGKTYCTDSIENQKGSPILDADDVQPNRIASYARSGTAAAATCWIYTARGAVTIKAVKAGLISVCTGNATVTVDVKKNGTTILSSTISLSSSQSNRDEVAGTLSVTSMVAADILEVVVTVDVGTGALGTGLFVWVDLNDEYAAS